MSRFWHIILILYAISAAYICFLSYPYSLIELKNYKLNVIWFLPETSLARLSALYFANEISLYRHYFLLETLSLLLVPLATLQGLLWGWHDKAQNMSLPVRPLALFCLSLFALYGLNFGLNSMIEGLAQKGHAVSLGVSAMPLYWMVGLSISALFTAHYVRLCLHDATLFMKKKWGLTKEESLV
jgi:hypothetical protein